MLKELLEVVWGKKIRKQRRKKERRNSQIFVVLKIKNLKGAGILIPIYFPPFY